MRCSMIVLAMSVASRRMRLAAALLMLKVTEAGLVEVVAVHSVEPKYGRILFFISECLLVSGVSTTTTPFAGGFTAGGGMVHFFFFFFALPAYSFGCCVFSSFA